MYDLEVVLTKRDIHALVREYRYTERVPDMEVAVSTAAALIARLAATEVDPIITAHAVRTGPSGTHYAYTGYTGSILGYANITPVQES